MQPSDNRAASLFMLRAIQDWGQSESERIAAVQGLLDAGGFKAQATCSPVFGGIWRDHCTGKDGRAATQWLQDITDTMKRGHLEDEIAHVERAIRERAAHAEGRAE